MSARWNVGVRPTRGIGLDMKIVVIGGTGLIGAQLVTQLRTGGHDVVAASPATGVNAVTGAGLTQALASADAVADVANSPSLEADAVMAFFETSARNLIAASRAAGVGHLIVLSVVGTERLLDSGYFRAKMAQENAIRAAGAPYTILRSTQFFEFAEGIAQSATEGGVVRLPPALVQPIASGDVAAALARLAMGPPVRDTVEVAGPERMQLADFVQRYLTAKGDRRTVSVDPHARYFGAPLSAESLTPDSSPRLGGTRLDDWLRGAAPQHG